MLHIGFYQKGSPIKVLVTGVAGFIGSNLAHELLCRGIDVVGIDAITDYYDPAAKRANLARLKHSAFNFVQGDLNLLDLESLIDDSIDVVFHLAGQPGVRKSWGEGFASYTHANVEATQRILEAVLARSPQTKFIYASSSSIYGEAETYPTTELTLPKPFSPYGVTKLAGEHLVSLYSANYDLVATSFRFFTVYGPGQRPDMAFTRFLGAADTGEEIVVYGSGEQIRDFTYVGDIVDALIRAGLTNGDLPRVMNLSGGASVSVLEVLATIGEIVPRPLNVRKVEPARGDVFRTGGDSGLARRSLGWLPRVSLHEGLRKQYEWIRSARPS
jgi:nucleoside-diphosphate-sugar epimerase